MNSIYIQFIDDNTETHRKLSELFKDLQLIVTQPTFESRQNESRAYLDTCVDLPLVHHAREWGFILTRQENSKTDPWSS